MRLPLLLVLATRTAGRDLVSSRARLRTAVLDGIEGHADLILFARTKDAQAGVAAAAEAISPASPRWPRLWPRRCCLGHRAQRALLQQASSITLARQAA